ncbi:hypothetical protein SPRG_19430 [Saprolegnia parasitica CBS 223.65]|uniref:Uncharacterized protein n=1 Tax=Saprolegnia parasitica (strain CBS 223.65) TaxID=695850 RepID=A0A067D280_SAPPC|nr:hypothetical protein SPRG_19430 [Saprolegnia parasitica CBS 223.65]KDO32856.1 hypothetical protein SPRG_19430 [Saprolegnia parasitica CBS 223.65]|eukprot:XP_012196664.1 hypothetical protein SPRG_19430 [Saprolegnia parasitica CBS 223.65]
MTTEPTLASASAPLPEQNNLDELTALASLLEMESIGSVYVEPEDDAMAFDTYISLETLALQSPHGGGGATHLHTWQDDNEDIEDDDDDPAAESNNSDRKRPDAVSSSVAIVDGPFPPSAPQDRRRPSLRKELFQQRIKSHDIASPGPKGDDHYAQSMTPECDLASPLLLPSSPVAEAQTLNAMEDNNAIDALEEALHKTQVRVPRARKVKHGGIYTLLLQGMKRHDDVENEVPRRASAPEPSLAALHTPRTSTTSTRSRHVTLGVDEHVPSSDVAKRRSPVQPAHVRHGSIYRMLRDKT